MRKRKKTATSEEMPDDVSQLEGWRRARHRLDPIATKVPTRRVTINLDEDVVAVFKAEAFLGGPPYQVAINQALRSYLRSREMSERERAAQTVLEALKEPAVVERLRELL